MSPVRLALIAVLVVVAGTAAFLPTALPPRAWAAVGVPFFIGLAAACSDNLRAVRWRTVFAGLALQLALAVLILKVPAVYDAFAAAAAAVQKFIDFTDQGARFVFGDLANPGGPPADQAAAVMGGPAAHIMRERIPARPFVFAFKALPAVVFVSSFFTVLYYLGVLQFVVKQLARVVVVVMGTSGAETLSAVANVFMGQTEAPLIVKPYVKGMTRSELLALMIGGMATISGAVMVAYVGMLNSIGMGDRAVAILATSVMAAPCGLYLAKILIPETEVPATRGSVKLDVERTHANVFDAAADGAGEGMKLALNVAAMLIAFIAFVALGNHLLGKLDAWLGVQDALGLARPLSLEAGFAAVFAPVAVLMGVSAADAPAVGDLLGTKLVLNEFVAYTVLAGKYNGQLDPRSVALAAYALTGFANFASIGIQLGGIGAMAPDRRADLARLGLRALLGGFLTTLVNASVAGILM